MKNIIVAAGFALVLFVIIGAAQKPEKVNFQTFDSYFERNDTGIQASKSYLAFTNQKAFDRIFHPAPTMGENHFLPDDVFQNKLVVATVRRGNSVRQYNHVTVTENKGSLFVEYTPDDGKPGSATYNSPLILAVEKGKYKEVVFLENGKRVGSVKVRN